MGDNLVQQQFKELVSRIHKEVLKPLGFRKDGNNFRLCHPDGLCKIINFQRSAFNPWFECRFTINMGIYYEPGEELENAKFKEYHCWIRNRAAKISPQYGWDYWWIISELEKTDMELLYVELKTLLKENVMTWFGQFTSKKETEQKYGYVHRHI